MDYIFDGYCNLCNRSIDLLIRWDKKRVFTYANLESEFAKKHGLSAMDIEKDTVILYRQGTTYFESSAVIEISKSLGWPLRILSWGVIVPKPLRDSIYRWIARNRYTWFGKKDQCRLPSAEEAALFMD